MSLGDFAVDFSERLPHHDICLSIRPASRVPYDSVLDVSQVVCLWFPNLSFLQLQIQSFLDSLRNQLLAHLVGVFEVHSEDIFALSMLDESLIPDRRLRETHLRQLVLRLSLDFQFPSVLLQNSVSQLAGHNVSLVQIGLLSDFEVLLGTHEVVTLIHFPGVYEVQPVGGGVGVDFEQVSVFVPGVVFYYFAEVTLGFAEEVFGLDSPDVPRVAQDVRLYFALEILLFH